MLVSEICLISCVSASALSETKKHIRIQTITPILASYSEIVPDFKGTGNVVRNVRDFPSLFTIMLHEDNDLVIVWSSKNQPALSLQGI